MKFLKDTIVLTTKLSKPEVQSELSTLLQGKRTDGIDYSGTVFRDSFTIRRVRGIFNRRNILPEITGQIVAESDTTEIRVEIKPNAFATAIIIIWTAGICFATISLFIGALTGNGLPMFAFLFPLGMLLFAFFMIKMSFKAEVEQTKKNLSIVFNADVK